MKIKPFGVEQWMNAYEDACSHNLAETCVDSLTVAELLELCGPGGPNLDELLPLRLSYGAITGSERLRAAIAALYRSIEPENVMVTHGAIGANALVHQTIVSPGDRVISVLPTYQQHYSIPESLGADVQILPLRKENQFLPDVDELASLVSDRTSLIAINNPNNPTGALIDADGLSEIVSVADRASAHVLCDEVYRGTDQEGCGSTESVADLYDRGISTGSMSKAFSLAGLRLGWIAGPAEVLDAVSVHRDYNTISVGMIDDRLATWALEQADRLLARSRRITRTNLAILSDWVDREPRLDWVKPRSGTTAFVEVDTELISRAFCEQLLAETGVLFTPGSALDLEGYVRIGYANDEKIVRDGLARTSEFLAAL